MALELKRLSQIAPEAIIALMNHPQVRRLMPLATGPFGAAECAAFVAGKEALWDEFGYGPWAFVLDGAFVGWGGFQPEEGDADLALVLHPQHWGAGRKIAPFLIAKAFDEWQFPSVTVLFPPTRTRIRALFKLGFQSDGEVQIHGERFLRFRLAHPKPGPIVLTERLVLRPVRVTDAAEVLTFRGDPEVQRYDDPPIATVDEARAFIEEVNRDAAAGKCLPLAIALKETDRVIGMVGFWEWDTRHRRAEIGYGIATNYWRQGIGAEAVRAAVRYGFDAMGLNRIYARTLVVNTRSVRMLERLGFVREGTQREYVLEDDGRFYDSALFALIRSDGRNASEP